MLALACLWGVRDRPGPAGLLAVVRHGRLIATLRAAWARPATRLGFWTHFGLMGPFVALTALWGYPYLVSAQAVAEPTARAWLAACVAAFGLGAPVLGVLVGRAPTARRPLLLGIGGLALGLWTATLAWPGGPPAAVTVAALVAVGLGGGASMVAFDIARAGNPAAVGGSATGLANAGGFLMAVIVQSSAASLLEWTGAGLGGPSPRCPC